MREPTDELVRAVGCPSLWGRGARAWMAAWCLSLLCLVGGGPARAEDPAEYRVKAAFLYNFTKFVDWPPSAFGDKDSPFVIGVVGRDPFGGMLDAAVSGKSVEGRSLVIRRYRQVSDIGNCQLLFVSDSEKSNVGRIAARAARTNTLVVGDSDRFLQHGGSVNFFLEDNRVRFEINPDAAESAGVKVSSKLLSLAKIVRIK